MTKLDDSSAYDKKLRDALVRHRVPGASFATWKDGKIEIATAGLLNMATGAPVQIRSMFQIGSITKSFTATLLMQLVEMGHVELDRPIRNYLPDFRVADFEASNIVTLRQLLCHTSGYAGDFFTDTGAGSDRNARYVDRCALLPQVHVPGAGFSYSNSGYSIAGRVVEVVAGRSWDDMMRRSIFGPLDLRDSWTEPSDLVGKSVAIGHSLNPKTGEPEPVAKAYYALSGAPAGATTTMSASDLIQFAVRHLPDCAAADDTEILSRRAITAMQESQVQLPFPTLGISHWGLGWFIFRWNGHEMFGHDGTTWGQSAFLRIHRASNTIAVLLTNGGAAQDLMDELFADIVAPMMGVEPPPVAVPVAQSPDRAERYVGTYRTIAGDTVIGLEDGRLTRVSGMRIDDAVLQDPRAILEYAGDNTFVFRRPNASAYGSVHFLDEDHTGRPSSIFSGLRLAHRVA